MSIEMKTIHASLKILGKRRTVYLNNEMLSKMVHVGMTVSIGEKYITCICGYNNFFPFNYHYYSGTIWKFDLDQSMLSLFSMQLQYDKVYLYYYQKPTVSIASQAY